MARKRIQELLIQQVWLSAVGPFGMFSSEMFCVIQILLQRRGSQALHKDPLLIPLTRYWHPTKVNINMNIWSTGMDGHKLWVEPKIRYFRTARLGITIWEQRAHQSRVAGPPTNQSTKYRLIVEWHAYRIAEFIQNKRKRSFWLINMIATFSPQRAARKIIVRGPTF